MRLSQCVALSLALLAPPVLALELPQWLAGHWRSESGGRSTDEVWLAPAQGLMTGMSRTTGGKRPFFEFVRIEQRADRLFYIAQPGGGEPTEFRAVRAAADSIEFENSAHDFPQRIIYERRGEDALAARIEGSQNGQPREERWSYRRVSR